MSMNQKKKMRGLSLRNGSGQAVSLAALFALMVIAMLPQVVMAQALTATAASTSSAVVGAQQASSSQKIEIGSSTAIGTPVSSGSSSSAEVSSKTEVVVIKDPANPTSPPIGIPAFPVVSIDKVWTEKPQYGVGDTVVVFAGIRIDDREIPRDSLIVKVEITPPSSCPPNAACLMESGQGSYAVYDPSRDTFAAKFYADRAGQYKVVFRAVSKSMGDLARSSPLFVEIAGKTETRPALSLSSVWPEKKEYGTGDKAVIFAKVLLGGRPATSADGVRVVLQRTIPIVCVRAPCAGIGQDIEMSFDSSTKYWTGSFEVKHGLNQVSVIAALGSAMVTSPMIAVYGDGAVDQPQKKIAVSWAGADWGSQKIGFQDQVEFSAKVVDQDGSPSRPESGTTVMISWYEEGGVKGDCNPPRGGTCTPPVGDRLLGEQKMSFKESTGMYHLSTAIPFGGDRPSGSYHAKVYAENGDLEARYEFSFGRAIKFPVKKMIISAAGARVNDLVPVQVKDRQVASEGAENVRISRMDVEFFAKVVYAGTGDAFTPRDGTVVTVSWYQPSWGFRNENGREFPVMDRKNEGKIQMGFSEGKGLWEASTSLPWGEYMAEIRGQNGDLQASYSFSFDGSGTPRPIVPPVRVHDIEDWLAQGNERSYNAYGKEYKIQFAALDDRKVKLVVDGVSYTGALSQDAGVTIDSYAQKVYLPDGSTVKILDLTFQKSMPPVPVIHFQLIAAVQQSVSEKLPVPSLNQVFPGQGFRPGAPAHGGAMPPGFGARAGVAMPEQQYRPGIPAPGGAMPPGGAGASWPAQPGQPIRGQPPQAAPGSAPPFAQQPSAQPMPSSGPGAQPASPADCVGCKKDNACLAVGIRLMGASNQAMFCDVDQSLKPQKDVGSSCQNSFECASNSCASSKCVDAEARIANLEKNVAETQGILQKIVTWMSRWFGTA